MDDVWLARLVSQLILALQAGIIVTNQQISKFLTGSTLTENSTPTGDRTSTALRSASLKQYSLNRMITGPGLVNIP